MYDPEHKLLSLIYMQNTDFSLKKTKTVFFLILEAILINALNKSLYF